VFVVLVVDNVTLVLSDDVQCTQYIQSIIDSSLYIFEVDSFTELFVQVQDLISYLSACSHGFLLHLLQDCPAQEHQLLILLLCPRLTQSTTII
jgi:hypothetical protein